MSILHSRDNLKPNEACIALSELLQDFEQTKKAKILHEEESHTIGNQSDQVDSSDQLCGHDTEVKNPRSRANSANAWSIVRSPLRQVTFAHEVSDDATSEVDHDARRSKLGYRCSLSFRPITRSRRKSKRIAGSATETSEDESEIGVSQRKLSLFRKNEHFSRSALSVSSLATTSEEGRLSTTPKNPSKSQLKGRSKSSPHMPSMVSPPGLRSLPLHESALASDFAFLADRQTIAVRNVRSISIASIRERRLAKAARIPPQLPPVEITPFNIDVVFPNILVGQETEDPRGSQPSDELEGTSTMFYDWPGSWSNRNRRNSARKPPPFGLPLSPRLPQERRGSLSDIDQNSKTDSRYGEIFPSSFPKSSHSSLYGSVLSTANNTSVKRSTAEQDNGAFSAVSLQSSCSPHINLTTHGPRRSHTSNEVHSKPICRTSDQDCAQSHLTTARSSELIGGQSYLDLNVIKSRDSRSSSLSSESGILHMRTHRRDPPPSVESRDRDSPVDAFRLKRLKRVVQKGRQGTPSFVPDWTFPTASHDDKNYKAVPDGSGSHDHCLNKPNAVPRFVSRGISLVSDTDEPAAKERVTSAIWFGQSKEHCHNGVLVTDQGLFVKSNRIQSNDEQLMFTVRAPSPPFQYENWQSSSTSSRTDDEDDTNAWPTASWRKGDDESLWANTDPSSFTTVSGEQRSMNDYMLQEMLDEIRAGDLSMMRKSGESLRSAPLLYGSTVPDVGDDEPPIAMDELDHYRRSLDRRVLVLLEQDRLQNSQDSHSRESLGSNSDSKSQFSIPGKYNHPSYLQLNGLVSQPVMTRET